MKYCLSDYLVNERNTEIADRFFWFPIEMRESTELFLIPSNLSSIANGLLLITTRPPRPPLPVPHQFAVR